MAYKYYYKNIGDSNETKPFLYLGAKSVESFTNAADYKSTNKQSDTSYKYEFCFYVPNSLSYSYSGQVDTINAYLDNSVLSGLNRGIDVSTVTKGLMQTGINVLMNETNNKMLGKGIDLWKQYQAIKGNLVDPMQLQIFKDASYASFDLNFTLIPESQKEAAEMKNMLNVLRYIVRPDNSSADSKPFQKVLNISNKLNDNEANITKLKKDKEKLLKDNNISETALLSSTDEKNAEIKAKLEKYNADIESNKSDSVASEVQDFIKGVANLKVNMWRHPLVFDMFVVTPTPKSTGKTAISNKNINNLYNDAKGMICTNIDIKPITNQNRADAVYYSNGIEIGWELNLKFTAISKQLVSGLENTIKNLI